MNFLQEAKYTALNIMGAPLGVRAVPKEIIAKVEGGAESVPGEQEVWLFGKDSSILPMRPVGIEKELRPVTLVEPNGKTSQWSEVVRPEQANQPITIYSR